MTRTPTEHRATLDAWRDAAPANDSDILPRSRLSTPRHAALAGEFKELLEWRRLAQPANTSTWWMASNDNEPLPDGYGAEREPRARDHDGARGPIEAAADRAAAIAWLKELLTDIAGEPIPPAIDADPYWRPGSLDGYEAGEARQAARLLLQELGVDGAVAFHDARARHGLPEAANDNQPAFPWQPRDPRLLFRSCRVRGSGTASLGAQRASSIIAAIEHAETAAYARGKLSAGATQILDAALEADNFGDIGRLAGHSGKTAERHGRRMLLAACAELRKLLADDAVAA